MSKKTISVRLKQDVYEMLAEFQARYHLETKKRMSQSEVINNALVVFINKVYQEAERLRNKNGKKMSQMQRTVKN